MLNERALIPQVAALGERYSSVRALSVAISELFGVEERLLQAMPEASPIKWHLAHTTWFFETFVLRELPNFTAVDERYLSLFNSYYNTLGPQPNRAERSLWSRPSLAEVADYRAAVDEAVLGALAQLNVEELERVELGLHHEQQHQELMLTDTLAGLAKNPLDPCAIQQKAPEALPLPRLDFQRFSGGLVETGHAGKGFHFDNEAPAHSVYLPGFELASRPLCNEEVIAFIDAGGYQRPEFWLSDGFDWVRGNGVQLPCYWRQRAGGYDHFTLHGVLPIDPSRTACHLNYFEADALARFFDARLPTESEWEHAAARYAQESGAVRPLEHWLTLDEWLPRVPAEGDLSQLLGTVWEWTSSAYSAYPGFRASAGAIGEYNGKFMHGQYVLRGGSLASPAGHVRASYRNFFPAHARWQFSGVRLARDVR
jgi:ergothioneine biosynthesis protein EgtB